MRTVVPIGGNVTPSLLLGWGPAVCLGAELECVALACPVAVDDDGEVAAAEAEAGPVLGADEEAVL